MYLSYFGLTENPFSLTPDPRFLFMSQRHREALAHLLFGMGDKGGFVLLTGEVGTGKTTLCRSLLEQVPEDVEVALVLNPKQNSLELVATICDELKVSYPKPAESLKILIDCLNRHLLELHAKGKRTVLIIDEAQNLSIDVLEQVRLLTNLETNTQKLMQILLIGQPELKEMMAKPELRQLGQRVTARYHLTPLSAEETDAYIEHRLEVAGCRRPLFTRGTLHLIYRLSGGIPRLINTICDRALLGAYGRKSTLVNKPLARQAAAEVIGAKARMKSPGTTGWLLALLLLVILAAGWFYAQDNGLGKWFDKWFGNDPTNLTNMATPANERVGTSAPEPLEHAADLFSSKTVGADREAAFNSLLRHWGLNDTDRSEKPLCGWVPTVGYRCYSGRGNWNSLKHLNRPSVLELVDNSGKRHYVAAMEIQDRKVILEHDGRRFAAQKEDLDPYWFGDFTLIWKPPPINSTLLKKGDRGPDVRWLITQLDRLQGKGDISENTVRNIFDDALELRVMDFQRSCAVNADGIVGEQTLIQLTKPERENLPTQMKRSTP
jgi:general secretion pathway protein A